MSAQIAITTFAKTARALLGGVLLLAACHAHAGLFDDDEARKAILDLRQRIDTNRSAADAATQKLGEDLKKANEDNAVLRRSLLDLQNQIEALRSDLAKLRGQDEQLARDVADIQRRQKDLAQGIDDRVRQLEPVKVSLEGKDFLAEPAEKREFEAALAAFRKSDFAAAQTQFVEFLRRYPRSGYGAVALFWLGNAQYATRDYKESVTNFRAMLTQSPDHPRAAEALLSIANCQVELKDPRAARKTLEDLVKAYPASEAAVAAKDRLTRLK
jgi:tol-pal system protein YbgF